MRLSESKKEAINLAGVLFSSAIIGKTISIPCGIIIAVTLGTQGFGELAIIYLIIRYFGYHHLGLLGNLSRNVPIAYGKNDLQEVQEITNVTFTSYSITALIGVFVLWTFFFSGIQFNETMNFPLLILITLIVIAERANSFLHTYTKAEGKFIVFGKKELINSVIAPVLNVIGVLLFNIYGIVISLLFIDLISLSYNYIALKRPVFKIVYNIKKSIELLKTGSMIFLNNILDGLVLSLVTWLLVYLTSKSEVGLFSFAIGISATTSKIPFSDAFSMTVGRKMLLDGGKYGINDLSYFKKYTQKTITMFLLLNSFVIGCLIIFYFFTVNLFLMEFDKSLPLMIILYSGFLVYTARSFLSNFFLLTNQLHKRMLIVIIGIILNLSAIYLLMIYGFGLVAVAFSTSFTFIFISINIIYLSLNQIYKNKSKGIIFIFKIITISILLSSCLWFFNGWDIIDTSLMNGTHKIFYKILEMFIEWLAFSFFTFSLFISFFIEFRIDREIILIISNYLIIIKNKLSAKII